jgi:aspartate 1-decarboxylase
MLRTLLKSKIHRATATEANLHYEGSITVDSNLLEAADILPNEQVDVLNIHNGSRLTTYAIPGPAGSGVICMNGAGARLVQPGDLLIICSYAVYAAEELRTHTPRVIHVDEQNRPLPAATP